MAGEPASFQNLAHQIAGCGRHAITICESSPGFLNIAGEALACRFRQSAMQHGNQLFLLVAGELVRGIQNLAKRHHVFHDGSPLCKTF